MSGIQIIEGIVMPSGSKSKLLGYVNDRTQGIYQGTYSATPGANTDVEIPGLTLTVTPTMNNSVLVLTYNLGGSGSGNCDQGFVVYKDGTIMPDSTNGSNNGWAVATLVPRLSSHVSNIGATSTLVIVDASPNVGVATEYQIRTRPTNTTNHSWYHNRLVGGTGSAAIEACMSSAIIMEYPQ